MKAVLLLLAISVVSTKSQFNLFNAASGAIGDATKAGINAATSVGKLFEKDFSSFQQTFNKQYSSPEEEKLRLDNFIVNKKQIDSFNEQFGKGVQTFTQGVNKFSDMLFDEFNQIFNGFKNSLRSKIRVSPGTTFKADPKAPIPESVDWREAGAVTPVKFQGRCASCWAFVAAGAIESHNFRKTGKLVEVSPQNLVDCSTAQGNEGCGGGLMEPAYEYVKVQPGINTHSAYSYEGKNGECKFQKDGVVAECKGYVTIPIGDEKSLEAAVATQGPVGAAIHVLPSFQNYKAGVYYDPKCSSNPELINHAVLIVGYGKEPNGQKYWLVKNSYGPDWGMDGYIKMAKDVKNLCGIATQATYPLM